MTFTWVPGMALSQSQKCIASLHSSIHAQLGASRILEISSKSPSHAGVALSAFNLHLTTAGSPTTVESAFQGSKVFECGGPYMDLIGAPSAIARKDPRIRNSGPLTGFRYQSCDWPATPRTAFYDWLYITSLLEHPDLARVLLDHDAFTDIAFNPAKSLNCQARSAALFVSLTRSGRLQAAMDSQESFLRLNSRAYVERGSEQLQETAPAPASLFEDRDPDDD